MSSQVLISTGAKRARRVSLTKGSKKAKTQRASSRNLTKASFGQGIPQSLAVTHKYVQHTFVTVGAGATTTLTFRANGLYDPDFSVGGHQPYLYDQLAPLYDHYMVKSARIKLTLGNYQPTDRFIVAGIVDDDGTWAGNINTTLERGTGGKSWCQLPPGSPAKTIYLNWSLPKNFQIKDGAGLSRFQGAAGTDPTEQSLFHFLIQNDGAASSFLDYTAEIEYNTLWTEVSDIAGS